MGHLFRVKLSVGRNKFRISIELNHSACLYSGNEYNDYITKYASSSHALKSQNRKVLLVVTIRYPLIFYKQHVFYCSTNRRQCGSDSRSSHTPQVRPNDRQVARRHMMIIYNFLRNSFSVFIATCGFSVIQTCICSIDRLNSCKCGAVRNGRPSTFAF